jgi:hypothetical protein
MENGSILGVADVTVEVLPLQRLLRDLGEHHTRSVQTLKLTVSWDNVIASCGY